jgi:hypothetical protein
VNIEGDLLRRVFVGLPRPLLRGGGVAPRSLNQAGRGPSLLPRDLRFHSNAQTDTGPTSSGGRDPLVASVRKSRVKVFPLQRVRAAAHVPGSVGKLCLQQKTYRVAQRGPRKGLRRVESVKRLTCGVCVAWQCLQLRPAAVRPLTGGLSVELTLLRRGLRRAPRQASAAAPSQSK